MLPWSVNRYPKTRCESRSECLSAPISHLWGNLPRVWCCIAIKAPPSKHITKHSNSMQHMAVNLQAASPAARSFTYLQVPGHWTPGQSARCIPPSAPSLPTALVIGWRKPARQWLRQHPRHTWTGRWLRQFNSHPPTSHLLRPCNRHSPTSHLPREPAQGGGKLPAGPCRFLKYTQRRPHVHTGADVCADCA